MSTELLDSNDFLTPDQVAVALNVTPTIVGEWIRKNKIPYHRLGWRCVRIRLSEVLDRSRVPATRPFAPPPKPLKKKFPEQGKRRNQQKRQQSQETQNKELVNTALEHGV